ncbi:hypothetical protein I350_00265 [Cryptococcus amylolentus CBS 6273]|uniref:FZ domain-containing protein n=1 Tax=Cryptococcus amylolentus CBS 6273 TaxID=1296118 RepID=A0A1E3KEP0_9TREE|nr:hypothetical protein I350_00265 [Cryptococcus amylolentus CBS 6273]
MLFLVPFLLLLLSVVSAQDTSATLSDPPSVSFSSLPTSVSLPPLNSSSPGLRLNFTDVQSLYLTLSICSLTSNTSLLPRALISASMPLSFDLGSKAVRDQSSGGLTASVGGNGVNKRSSKDGTTWEMEWSYGFGNWSWSSNGGGYKDVGVLFGLGLDKDGQTLNTSMIGSGNVVMQLDASTRSQQSGLTAAYPKLGDTTASQVLLFSPLLYSSIQEQPTYPNYTLPGPQLAFPDVADLTAAPVNSSLSKNMTLMVVPTTSSPSEIGLDLSQCAVNAAFANASVSGDNNTVVKSARPEWMAIGNQEGFRTYWVLGGLEAGTNYTAWIKDDKDIMSRPAWFGTKNASFPCQLTLPNDICPNIGYSAPLSPNATTINSPTGELISNTTPITSFPDEIADVLADNLQAFSTSLLTRACGRDLFSHVSTCADCYSSYRDWLCRMVVPQCGPDYVNTTSTSTSSSSASSTIFPLPSTTPRTVDNPRNEDLPDAPYDYNELLPCLSVCNRADRQCPVWLGIRCPKRKVNAAKSYAFVGEHSSFGDGSAELGMASEDRWGNKWCNG